MAPANKVVEVCYAWSYKRFLNVFTDVAGRHAVEWQVSAFCADDEFVSRILTCRLAWRVPHQSIVHFVENDSWQPSRYVRPEFNSANNRFCVTLISRSIGVAEISANADRTQRQTLLISKMIRGCVWEAVAISIGAFGRGERFDCR
jgi:hypothetical protein